MISTLFKRSKRRHPGDPRVVRKGPSALGASDRLAKALGWFSIGLGLVELLAPGRVARPLGVPRASPLIRAFGAREIATGIGALSVDPRPALWSRVGGDAMDLAALAYARTVARRGRRRTVDIVLALVAGVAVLDLVTGAMLQRRHGRRGPSRDYSDRSGFPAPPEQMRGRARELALARGTRATQPVRGQETFGRH
jgi:hypothetical protein